MDADVTTSFDNTDGDFTSIRNEDCIDRVFFHSDDSERVRVWGGEDIGRSLQKKLGFSFDPIETTLLK